MKYINVPDETLETSKPTNADGVKCYSLGEVMDHVADPTTEHPTKWVLWADFLKLREENESLKKERDQAHDAALTKAQEEFYEYDEGDLHKKDIWRVLENLKRGGK